MVENYYAFALSIIKNYPPEASLNIITGKKMPGRYRTDITDQDIIDMKRMFDSGKTHRQIGELYGINKDGVAKRIQRLRREVAPQSTQTPVRV